MNLHLKKFNIAQINFDYTRITSPQQPSCIDHLYSNCSNKITNVRTITNYDSDNKYIVARYNTKEPLYNPKPFLKRDYSNLTSVNIDYCIDRSEILNNIFTSEDTDFIAESIQIELNSIIIFLAPGKLVQFK